MTTSPTANIVCFGDSLTEAPAQADEDKWTTRLQLLLDGWQPDRFRVFNRGISGNTTALALDRIDADVLKFLPGWAIVGFGLNDANFRPNRLTPRVGVQEFARNLEEIHRLIAASGGRVLFIAEHNPDPDDRTMAEGRKYDQGNGATYAENFLPYRKAVLRIARRTGSPVLDMAAALAKSGRQTADIVVPDGIHLTVAGNLYFADTIFRWLQRVIKRGESG